MNELGQDIEDCLKLEEVEKIKDDYGYVFYSINSDYDTRIDHLEENISNNDLNNSNKLDITYGLEDAIRQNQAYNVMSQIVDDIYNRQNTDTSNKNKFHIDIKGSNGKFYANTIDELLLNTQPLKRQAIFRFFTNPFYIKRTVKVNKETREKIKIILNIQNELAMDDIFSDRELRELKSDVPDTYIDGTSTGFGDAYYDKILEES